MTRETYGGNDEENKETTEYWMSDQSETGMEQLKGGAVKFWAGLSGLLLGAVTLQSFAGDPPTILLPMLAILQLGALLFLMGGLYDVVSGVEVSVRG